MGSRKRKWKINNMMKRSKWRERRKKSHVRDRRKRKERTQANK